MLRERGKGASIHVSWHASFWFPFSQPATEEAKSEQLLLPLKRAGYPAATSGSPCDGCLAFMRVLLCLSPFFPGSFILCLPK